MQRLTQTTGSHAVISIGLSILHENVFQIHKMHVLQLQNINYLCYLNKICISVTCISITIQHSHLTTEFIGNQNVESQHVGEEPNGIKNHTATDGLRHRQSCRPHEQSIWLKNSSKSLEELFNVAFVCIQAIGTVPTHRYGIV